MAKILLIDDDRDFLAELSQQLEQDGHEVISLLEAEEGLRRLVAEPFDLVLVDNGMPRMGGLEFLRELKKELPQAPPVILMTSAHNDTTAIQATKFGAFDYVIKAEHFDAILLEMKEEIHRALKVVRPPQIAIPADNAKEIKDDSVMQGRSRAMRAIFRRIGLLEEGISVLILGETGTGKELVAQAIHTNSARRKCPFVAINCSAIPPSVMESELFGHEQSAFTGAAKMRKGYFEHANGGTLLLDEIGEMPEILQVKLLRVLESKEIIRVGGCEPIRVNIRILAATSRDLPRYLREGKFRPDLYYRLEGTIIKMPALRDRQEDIERLAKHFLRIVCGENPTPALSADALHTLKQYPWPGNIRQLLNVMRRARTEVNARCGTEITPQDLIFGEDDRALTSEPILAPAVAPNPALSPKDAALSELRDLIASVWNSADGKKPWPVLQELLKAELTRFALSQPYQNLDQLAKQIGISKGILIDWKRAFGSATGADEV